MKTLIVIDMQNDFVTGPLGTKEAVAIIPKINQKIEAYHKNEDQIIFTRDMHFNDYLHTTEGKHLPVPHCIYPTEGWHIAKGIHVYHNSRLIDKEHFGSLHLEKAFRLKRSEAIEIVGVCTDICVITNALILKTQLPDTEITVDASCCAGTTPDMHKAALQVMKSCQINVINEE